MCIVRGHRCVPGNRDQLCARTEALVKPAGAVNIFGMQQQVQQCHSLHEGTWTTHLPASFDFHLDIEERDRETDRETKRTHVNHHAQAVFHNHSSRLSFFVTYVNLVVGEALLENLHDGVVIDSLQQDQITHGHQSASQRSSLATAGLLGQRVAVQRASSHRRQVGRALGRDAASSLHVAWSWRRWRRRATTTTSDGHTTKRRSAHVVRRQLAALRQGTQTVRHGCWRWTSRVSGCERGRAGRREDGTGIAGDWSAAWRRSPGPLTVPSATIKKGAKRDLRQGLERRETRRSARIHVLLQVQSVSWWGGLGEHRARATLGPGAERAPPQNKTGNLFRRSDRDRRQSIRTSESIWGRDRLPSGIPRNT